MYRIWNHLTYQDATMWLGLCKYIPALRLSRDIESPKLEKHFFIDILILIGMYVALNSMSAFKTWDINHETRSKCGKFRDKCHFIIENPVLFMIKQNDEHVLHWKDMKWLLRDHWKMWTISHSYMSSIN